MSSDKSPFIAMGEGVLNIDAIDYIRYARKVMLKDIGHEIFLRSGKSIIITKTEFESLKKFMDTEEITDY